MDRYNICKYCGKEYKIDHHSGKSFCSWECYKKYRAPKVRKIYPRYDKICTICGKHFITGRGNQLCCSKECQMQYNRERTREASSLKHQPKVCKCKECGAFFMPEYGNKHRAFCSDECSNAYAHKSVRNSIRHKNGKRKSNNVRKRIITASKEKFTYEDIYTRDKGVCQICGLPVIKDKAADYDWSGCIDHVIPICKGGEHSINNCQLTHRICNCLKDKSDEYKVDWNDKASRSNLWHKRFEKYKSLVSA